MKIISSNLILADFVRSATAGKKDVYGTLNAVNAPNFPASLIGAWFFWLATIESEGSDPFRATVRLQVRRPDGTRTELLTIEIEGAGNVQAGAIEIAQPLPPLAFNEPGARVFEIWLGEQVVASAALLVQQLPAQGGPPLPPSRP